MAKTTTNEAVFRRPLCSRCYSVLPVYPYSHWLIGPSPNPLQPRSPFCPHHHPTSLPSAMGIPCPALSASHQKPTYHLPLTTYHLPLTIIPSPSLAWSLYVTVVVCLVVWSVYNGGKKGGNKRNPYYRTRQNPNPPIIFPPVVLPLDH